LQVSALNARAWFYKQSKQIKSDKGKETFDFLKRSNCRTETVAWIGLIMQKHVILTITVYVVPIQTNNPIKMEWKKQYFVILEIINKNQDGYMNGEKFIVCIC